MRAIFTRVATLRDVEAIALLFDAYRQFYEQASDILLATTFIRERIQRNESVIFVAENEDQLLGFCQLYPTYCSVAAAPIYSLYDLFVRPDARKSGAGRALLLATEQHAAHNGFVRMDLTTAKTNLSAQSLYESLGWIRDEVFYAYSKSVQS
jgi:ribosomal protein S18 acetylase RimI-like enzyme